jgi:hypothetical protein
VWWVDANVLAEDTVSIFKVEAASKVGKSHITWKRGEENTCSHE